MVVSSFLQFSSTNSAAAVDCGQQLEPLRSHPSARPVGAAELAIITAHELYFSLLRTGAAAAGAACEQWTTLLVSVKHRRLTVHVVSHVTRREPELLRLV